MNIMSLLDSAKKKQFFRQLQVLHVTPGRVRLYSPHIINKPELVRQINLHLATIPEINQFTINAATGSILIHYSPAAVIQNPFLRDIEQIVVKNMGGYRK